MYEYIVSMMFKSNLVAVNVAKENEFNIIEKNMFKWKREFDKKQVYHLFVGPILYTLRLMGRAPFYRDNNNGLIRYKRYSAIMVYSVIVHMLFSITAILSLLDVIQNSKRLFTEDMDILLISIMIVPQLIIPVISWFQTNSQQEYLNKWVVLQNMFDRVTCNNFPQLSELQPSAIIIFTHYVIPVFIIMIVMPYYLSAHLKYGHLLAFYVSNMNNILYFWYWLRTSKIISEILKRFCINFQKEIMKKRNYTRKIEEFRLLWMKITEVIQDYGSSSAFIISVFILSNLFYLIVILHKVIYIIPFHIREGHYEFLIVYIIVILFWWMVLQSYCNAGYEIMENCMYNMLMKIIHMEEKNIYEQKLYMNVFLFSLRKYPPNTSISNYYSLNRKTFGDVIKSLITYLILLDQLQMSPNEYLSKNN